MKLFTFLIYIVFIIIGLPNSVHAVPNNVITERITVQSCTASLCNENNIINCEYIDYVYNGDRSDDPLNFSFTPNDLPNDVQFCRWEINSGNNPIGDDPYLSESENFDYTFPRSGTYTVCLYFYNPSTDCLQLCCRTIRIENPYRCNRILYNYQFDRNRYELTLDGDAQDIVWRNDADNTILGTDTILILAVSNICATLPVSVHYYDATINQWRNCRKVISLCPPIVCQDAIEYAYNGSSIEVKLNAENVELSTVEWIDSEADNHIFANYTLQATPYSSLPDPCAARWISVRYFDKVAQQWQVCSRRIFFCDPFECAEVIEADYNSATDSYDLSLQNTSFDPLRSIEWINDESNRSIGNGATIEFPVPNSCRVLPICVNYYDSSENTWRICCRYVDTCPPNYCSVDIESCQRTLNNCSYVDYRFTDAATTDNLQFSFATDDLPDEAEFCRWEIYEGSSTGTLLQTIEATAFDYIFANVGNYTLVLYYFDLVDECLKKCQRSVFIDNPDDCNLINNSYLNELERTEFTLATLATDVSWFNETTGDLIGRGDTINITVPADCQSFIVSVRYFDVNDNQWRFCRQVMNVCPPEEVQLPVVLWLGEVAGRRNTTVYLPVVSAGFQRVASFQYSLQITNPNVVRFNESENIISGAIAASNLDFIIKNDSTATITWVENINSSVADTITNDTIVLYQIPIEIIGMAGNSSLINFADAPQPIMMVDSNQDTIMPILGGGKIVVTESPALQVSTSHSNIKCFGETTGTIVLNIQNGSGAYDVHWSHDVQQNGIPSNSIILANLAAGTYVATITDSETQIAFTTDEITITEPPVLYLITEQVNDLYCQEDQSGAIAISASGGTPNYTYLWNTGAIESSIENLSAGDFSVTLTDTNECQQIASFTLNEPTAINIEITTLPVSAGINGRAIITTRGGTMPYTYNWSHDENLTDSIAYDLIDGMYEVIITDARGCTQSSTFEIERLVAVNQWGSTERLQIFPNPVQDYLMIQSTGEVNKQANIELEIYNLQGKLVYRKEVLESATLRLNLQLSDDIYLIKLQNYHNTIYGRFVVQSKGR